MTSAELLPFLRDLYSKPPEMRDLEAWELQQALCSEGGERSEPEIDINGPENRPRGDMSEKVRKRFTSFTWFTGHRRKSLRQARKAAYGRTRAVHPQRWRRPFV
jgi:hypothetical protein